MTSPPLALIGASGGMGAFVLAELTARQLPVRAVVRRTDAVAAADLVQPVRADVYRLDELTAALAGVQTVISSFNPGWDDPDLYANYLRGAANIQRACRTSGVGRLIVVGGASSLLDENGRKLLEAGLPPEPYGSGVRAASDYLDEISTEEDLDWAFVSPPAECGPIGPSGRTGHYRIGQDRPLIDADGRNSLSREDLAVAIVDEAIAPRHHRVRFTVGY